MTHVQPTSLYRLYDEAGTLLYVGIASTARGMARIKEHESTKPDFWQVSFIKVEHFAQRIDAETAEIEAIRGEGPRWNKIHRPKTGDPVEAFALRPGEVKNRNGSIAAWSRRLADRIERGEEPWRGEDLEDTPILDDITARLEVRRS